MRCPLLLSCLLLPGLAWAATPPAFQPVEGLKAAAEAYVRAQLGGAAEVTAERLDERVRLPSCASAPNATRSGQAGNTARWTVALSCAGPQSWTLYVPVRVSQPQNVLVARRNLPAGSMLVAADLRNERRDTATLPQGYVDEQTAVAGLVLSRPLAAGAVLTPGALAKATVIKRGEAVTLVGRSGSFEIRAQGKAMADAAPGDRLAVENMSSRRLVQGRVLADGSVEVPL
ncbi:flagellar basal body P-ring formation chaperone FlgA [Hydrocarboniphaga effusa]|uniref:flagellar basal body P-ring formation chaperone FlgA n=2 Tax=Hydrocarboniphaga effusa TaxID=243629 RepID=UPI0031381F08